MAAQPPQPPPTSTTVSPDRVWVLFDWDMAGWQKFLSDPEVPPIIKEAGHKSKPQAAELGGKYDS